MKLADLIPLNLAAEKEKFFANNKYNPQFEYVRDFSRDELLQFGLPNESYVNHARRMLDIYGGLTTKVDNYPTIIATEKEITDAVKSLCSELQIHDLGVQFSTNLRSPLLQTKDTLIIRLPISFSTNALRSKINHEVQTHFLRWFNDEKNNSIKQKLGQSRELILLTEEGLANLNGFVGKSNQILQKTYLSYYAAHLAQTGSFSHLYNELRSLGIGSTAAWDMALRQKRGLTDTSQPGGWSKNHLYLEGTVKVARWILNPQNDPRLLYAGKIAIEDIQFVKTMPPNPELIYPTFFQDMDNYKQEIANIYELNQLDQLPSL